MEQILKYFTDAGIQLYDDKGKMKNTKSIIEQIIKYYPGFEKIILIQKLNEYINLKEGI